MGCLCGSRREDCHLPPVRVWCGREMLISDMEKTTGAGKFQITFKSFFHSRRRKWGCEGSELSRRRRKTRLNNNASSRSSCILYSLSLSRWNCSAPRHTHSQHAYFIFHQAAAAVVVFSLPSAKSPAEKNRATSRRKSAQGNFGVVTFAKCEQNREHALWLKKHSYGVCLAFETSQYFSLILE